METAATPAFAPVLYVLRALAMIAITLALPVFLVSSAVRGVALNRSFYQDEFTRYGVGQVTGLPPDELNRVAQAFIDYFQGEPGRMDVTVQTRTGPAPLFNEREIAHMVDVQAIMRLFVRGWLISALVLMLGIVLIVAVDPPTGARELLRAVTVGGALLVIAIGALAIGALIDFERLFVQFHMLSFSNDLWLLDPATDRLIQLFPEGFFYDSAIRIAVQTVGTGLLALVGGLVALHFLPESWRPR
jgi:integral membrane protein (TIGR01906 family)